MPTYLSPAPPRVLAHRGLALTAVENTELAFRDAIAAGAKWIETDAHVTADGVAVLWHDPDLRRFDGTRDTIASLPWPDLRARTVKGARLLTVGEALAMFPEARFNIDVKVEPALKPVVQAVLEAQAIDRVLLASFSDARRRRASAAIPGIATSPGMAAIARCALATYGSRRKRQDRWRAALAGAVAVQVPPRYFGIPIVTRAFVASAHESGVEVHVWTINDPVEMRAMLALGVDGIVTDRADIACELIRLSTPES